MILSHGGTAASVRDDLKAHLEEEKDRATQEIRNYPQPIAGCDAQIPALWERRDNLVEDISRLVALSADGSAETLEKFIVSCSSLNAEDKKKFSDRIKITPIPQARSAAE